VRLSHVLDEDHPHIDGRQQTADSRQ
jgi:hypothetical protein